MVSWLLVLNGLRCGEALGMRWAEVDFDGGKLHKDLTVAAVRVSCSRTGGPSGFTDHGPKTKLGKGFVVLDPWSNTRLPEMRRTHPAEWWRLCQWAGVPDLGPDAARHGHINILRAAGVPDRIIAQRLGRSEVVMGSIYGPPFVNEQEQATEVMAELFGQSVSVV